MNRFVLDRLESRRLLSAASFVPTGARIIAADKAEVAAAQTQAQNDKTTAGNLSAFDNEVVVADRYAVEHTSAQKAKLTADQAAASTTTQTDQAAIQTAAQNNLGLVIVDYEQIATDSGNSAALVGDQAQLATDQATLQAATLAAVNQLQSDQAASQATIANDQAAITALLQSNAPYTEAVAKQTADAAAAAVTAATDAVVLQVMQVKLQVDENTYGSQSGSSINVGDGPGYTSNAVTAADQAEVSSIQAQLTLDQQTQKTDTATDTAAVQSAKKAILVGSKQQAKLFADQAAAPLLLAADRTAARQAAKADLPAVISALEQTAADQGDSSALAFAQELLVADREMLNSDVSNAEKKLQADQTSTQAKIARDEAAVNALLQSSTTYTSAAAKLKSDTTTDDTKVQADQAILAAANAKLQADHGAPVGGISDPVFNAGSLVPVVSQADPTPPSIGAAPGGTLT
jgi:hypothetical protein